MIDEDTKHQKEADPWTAKFGKKMVTQAMLERMGHGEVFQEECEEPQPLP